MGSMRVIYRLTILLLSGLLLVTAGVADSGENHDVVKNIEDQGNLPLYADGNILVKSAVSPDGSVQSLNEIHTSIGAKVAHDYANEGIPGLSLVSLPANMSVTDAVSYYSVQAGVSYAEPDYYRYITAVPTDPEFWRQWGLQNTGQVYKPNSSPGIPGADVKATGAWDIATGNGPIVAVLDSGADYTHPDLAANIWTDPATGTHGYDAISGVLDPMDQHGHGSHCSGIIGAAANNGIGGSGINWNATIMPIRWLDSNGMGFVSDEIAAIGWASMHGAKIMSCSYGSSSPSKSEEEMIAKTNALFFVAAGNSKADIDINPEYPAAYNLSNLIAVAATTPNDTLADFSNYGNHTVYLGAPGTGIYSTVRSVYEPVPLTLEPFTTLGNWTIAGNWTLDSTRFVSAPSSVHGFVNLSADNSSSTPTVLTQNSSLINLTGIHNPVISYQISLEGKEGGVYLEIGDTSGYIWMPLDATMTWSVTDNRFILKQVRIPDEFANQQIVLRFVAEGSGLGVTIDDLTLSDGYGVLKEPEWSYYSGTSMATPMVAGAATLLSGYAPNATLSQIRDALLNSTDPIPALTNTTITGGRLNLTAALNAIHPSPSSHGIPVAVGWNHISVPRHLANGSDTAQIFADINSSGHSVLMYQNDTAGYRTLESSDKIQPLQGYWLYSANATTVPVTFAEHVVGSGREVPAGWSSVGGWSDHAVSANETLSSLGGNWSYLVGYLASDQQYDEPIIRGGTGNQSDSRLVDPWQGYWLYCTTNGTFQGPLA